MLLKFLLSIYYYYRFIQIYKSINLFLLNIKFLLDIKLIINFFFENSGKQIHNKEYTNSNYFIYVNNEYYYLRILNRMFYFKFNKMKKIIH